MLLREVRHGRWLLYAVCTDRGDCPLLEFLDEDGSSQPGGSLGKQKLRMLARLDTMAEEGPPRNASICHRIEDEIWQIELGRIRLLWFYDAGRIVILSHGFIKSTQKTPESEKRIAREALRRYRRDKALGRLRILEDP